MESTINIENVVASTKLAEEFDLIKIEAELEGAEYNKRSSPVSSTESRPLKLLFSYSLPAR